MEALKKSLLRKVLQGLFLSSLFVFCNKLCDTIASEIVAPRIDKWLKRRGNGKKQAPTPTKRR